MCFGAGCASSAAAGSALSSALVNLRSLARRLENVYDVSLPVPQPKDLGEVKEFCSGLLTGSKVHPWFVPIRDLALRDRLSVSGSLFLFRKTLVVLDDPCLRCYRDKMSSPAPDPPPGYLSFVSRELKKMFPLGWDRGWRSSVLGCTLRSSSCIESGRKGGGALGLLARHEVLSRSEFCEELLNKYSTRRPQVDRVRVMNAMTAGKVRTVTVNSVDMSFLDPFHRLLYDHVSEQSWCLRGQALPRSFSDFVQKDGEVFVSGDYESATDNLNQDVARHILGVVSRQCTRVPVFVREAGLRSLECTAFFRESTGLKDFVVRRGQLMGNSLSFPLLCLQNYLSFKFLLGRDVPVKINGDDIVFRATPSEFESWADGVSRCGLTLSRGKTAVSRRWFSLNSTFFVAGTVRVREAPVIRSTCFVSRLDCPESLSGRIETLRAFRPDRRDKLVGSLLSKFSASVWASQRSLRRGHGVRVSDRALKLSGLAEREGFYLSLPDKFDPPFPVVQTNYVRHVVPKGWARVWSTSPVNQEVQRRFFRELVDEAWNPSIRVGSEVADYSRGTLHFVPFPRRRFARWLGLGAGDWRRLRSEIPRWRRVGVARWVFEPTAV
nr:MAG: RNA-dependent RNA polymerase [Mbeech associated botourmia-like virus 43]